MIDPAVISEIPVYVTATAKVWMTCENGIVIVNAEIPQSGLYRSTYNHWANWFLRGVHDCVARIVEVHDGFGNDLDWIPAKVYALWPVNILATMCGEWEGGVP